MREIKNITVFGAGLMGAGIAQVSAEAGYRVCLIDINQEIVHKSIESICKRWESKIKKGTLTAEDAKKYCSNLFGSADKTMVSNADLVIEAIVEKYEVKSKLFKELGELCGEDIILATNTSSISISKLASVVQNPERFIGLHFFSPVPVMKLLEIIPGFQTAEEVFNEMKQFGENIGKVCIKSKDTYGFIVNRLLDPMINEAIRMLDEGVGTIEDIDNGMKYGCGHPMGPFELIDMAGIDVEYMVMQVFYEQTGNPLHLPAPLLKKMVDSGYIGKKAKKGFYIYHEDGSKSVNPIFNR